VCRETGRTVPAVPDRVMDLLRTYDWPGNVRELENALTRAAVLAQGAIESEHLALGLGPGPDTPPGAEASAGGDPSLLAVELRHVQNILLRAGGSKTKAAAMLGISRPRLNRLLDKHRIPVS
jgi:DNA-binding NtrC family response regulator